MKTISLTITLFLGAVSTKAQGLDQFFAATDNFLKKYVVDGNVKYKAIKENGKDLNSIYEQIASIDLNGKSADEIKAFYINSYNVLVIYQVVERYPLKGPLTVSSFFNGIKHDVAGSKLTLDELEKGTLYKKYPDPRIHFAVVCAALGCPQIAPFAFAPNKLEQQLNERASMALNRDYFIRVSNDKGKVEVSKIFEWYQGHFSESGSVLEYINRYRKEKIPANFKLRFYEYDWDLNDAS